MNCAFCQSPMKDYESNNPKPFVFYGGGVEFVETAMISLVLLDSLLEHKSRLNIYRHYWRCLSI